MRARLLVLALGLIACKSDPDSVTVSLSLDTSTCSFEAPDAVTITCAATAGVWLRGADGAYLGQACVDFDLGAGDDDGEGDADGASGEGANLASLSDLLGDVSLSTEETGAVSVEVAVYAGWSADQGCPPPDQARALDVPPAIVVAGRSTPAPLADSGGAVEVLLGCESITLRPTDDQCDELCQGDQQDCLQGVNAEQCDAAFGTCVRSCEGDECTFVCEDEYDDCLSDSPDGLCTLDEEICLDQCDEGDFSCEVDCSDANDACYDEACSQVYTDCVDQCSPDDGECATYTP